MPSLSDKLKALGVQVGTRNIKAPISKNRSSLVDVLNGEWHKTSSGDCFVVSKSLPFDTKHGVVSLDQFQTPIILERLPGLEGISDIPINKYLFIDTETSSLSGGTGSYVFLIGAAKYTKSSIQFKQFFLEDPSIEPAQLAALEEFASSAKVIISYNGKAFDLPRLKTRFKLHGWPSPFDDILHIDLLHIARRLWKAHLPACNLGEIEHQILDISRSELDVPGYEIARLFFDYLQSGNPAPLKSVFYHNEVDVISLISLYIHILMCLSNPLSQESDELISIGLYISHLRFDREAIAILEKALITDTISDTLRFKGMEHLAKLYKKNKEYQKALPLWRDISAEEDTLSPYIELAMFYEHIEKDFQEALHWTLSAIDLFSQQSESSQSDDLIQLNHRLSRLKKKLSKAQDSA
jgi:uncharacterized protein YprB with RNaseH-like and TPR domain